MVQKFTPKRTLDNLRLVVYFYLEKDIRQYVYYPRCDCTLRMQTGPTFSTVDTHTAGEPTRIITDGPVFSPGEKTTVEYREEFRAKYSWVRELLIKEPRGHDDMFGAIPVSTTTPEADFGLFFITNDGYLDMCGHATIGVITAFIELGRLPTRNTIVVETPAGLVEARPMVSDGTVESVEIQNVKSFFYDSCKVTVADERTVDVDIVYSGNFFAMVDITTLGLTIEKENANRLIKLGLQVRRKVNEKVEVTHPFSGDSMEVALTEFYEHDHEYDRNFTVFGEGTVDRSPCGSGTCAKMTLLHYRGDLDIGERYHIRSVIETEFEGEIESVEDRDGYAVVRPSIIGSAYIISQNQYSLDPDDPIIGFSIAKEEK